MPFPVAIGAIVILAASLIASRELLDSIIDHDWNIVVYMIIAVVVGYGPSVVWMWYASQRWGTGRVVARPRRQVPVGRPRLGPVDLDQHGRRDGRRHWR